MAGERLIPREPVAVTPGAVHLPGRLDDDLQRWLLDRCRAWARAAGGYRAPRMRNGAPMSVGMVGLGWHWYPYRYSRTVDDDDGRPVVSFPPELGELAGLVLADAAALDPSLDPGPDGYRPDVALLNRYGPGARMGMHADTDEVVDRPVVSVSLGDTGVFRWGNTETRGRPWVDVPLESGDAFVFGGPARRAFHGLPRVRPGTAPTWWAAGAGRLNVTVRQTGLV